MTNIEHNIIVLANIIDDCNLCCRYCYNAKPYTHKFLDLNQLFNLITYITTITKQNITLNIEGGEPTIHPQLQEFCKKLQTIKRCNAFIYTNLLKHIDFYKSLLSNSNTYIIATCHDNNIHFYDKTKQLIDNYRQKIELKIMYEDNAIRQSINMFLKCKNLDVKVDLIYIFNVKNYKAKYSQIDIDRYKQLVEDEDKLYKFSIDEKTYCLGDSEINMYASRFSYKNYLCNAGIQTLYIHNNGDIFYCPEYYYEKKTPICTISNFEGLLFKHPIMCTCDHCPDYVDIKKSKVFSKK